MLADFRVRQRDYLLEISRAMTAQLDLATVLRMVLEAAAAMLAGQAGLIAFREENGGFTVRASYGLPEPVLELLSPLWTDLPEGGDQRWRAVELELTVRDVEDKKDHADCDLEIVLDDVKDGRDRTWAILAEWVKGRSVSGRMGDLARAGEEILKERTEDEIIGGAF